MRVGFEVRTALILGLVSFLLLAGAPARAASPYTLDMKGMPDPHTWSLLGETSELINKKNDPPPSLTALRNRVRGDVDRVRKILDAYGYFDGTIDVSVDEEKSPVPVVMVVTPGPRFKVGQVRLTDPAGIPLGPALSPARMALKPGDDYTAQAVIDTEGAILADLGRKGRPFARVAKRDVALNRAATAVDAAWAIDYGPLVNFGAVRFEGLERLKDKPARELLRWTEGEQVDTAKVEETRRAFVETGLFRTVTVTVEPPADGRDGPAPVLVRLEESPPRTVGGGIRYSTSEGAGLRAFWEHRNLLGGRESLRVTADVAQTGYSLEGRARKPDFEWRGVDLVGQVQAEQEELEAYDMDRLLIGAGLEWRYSPEWFFSGGATLEQSYIDDQGRSESYTLVGFPVVARQDTSNDVLDPTRGHRLTFSVTPYYDLAGTAGLFVVSKALGSVYLPLDDAADYVLALRGGLGATFGGSTLSLPADKRFFAGGGDSVRGYAFQKAGPLGADGDATGGKSLATGAIEMRWRITESIGIVPFVDFGSVFEDSLPDFGADLFVGAGLGLRYMSPIGPLRLDVATPVAGKRNSDDIIQIYISIGQAF